jgi:phosphate starvation-inducible PhoH-like protein
MTTKCVETGLRVNFADNQRLPLIFGPQDCHLRHIEERLNVQAHARGGCITLHGTQASTVIAKQVFQSLYHHAARGHMLETADVEHALCEAELKEGPDRENLNGTLPLQEVMIKTRKKIIIPRSRQQLAYVQTMVSHTITLALGPAGTGKTYLAVAMAVASWLNHEVDKIVLARPALEAGEKIGFLPGDLKEKIDPYLRPIYDALDEMLPAEILQRALEQGSIEIAPIGFMRGRTLKRAYVIIDEAQNTTPLQMRMLLTRLGEDSRFVIAGDPTQSDLPGNTRSGLVDAAETLACVPGIAIVRLSERDVIRHPLIQQILQAYDARQPS